MILHIAGTIAFGIWLILYWNIQIRSRFFARHYFLGVLALVISAIIAGILGYLWMSQSLLGILIGTMLFILSILFAGLAFLDVQMFMEARFLKLGKLFRNSTWHEAAPIAFSVEGDIGGDAWTQPMRQLEKFDVMTEDNVRIRGVHITAGHPNVVIIAHGSFRSKNTAAYVFLAQWLAYKFDVITFDFRGHGESAGDFDMSDAPVLDLKAVIDHARSKGYQKLGVFGRSVGGWIALLEAAKYKNVDTVVAAAAPLTQVVDIDSAQSLARLQRIPILGKIWTLFARWVIVVLRGTRFGGFSKGQHNPIDVVSQISPIPVFFIYQEYDRVIKTDAQDAVAIFEAAKGNNELLILAGPGHIFEVHQFHRVYSAIEAWFDKTFQQ